MNTTAAMTIKPKTKIQTRLIIFRGSKIEIVCPIVTGIRPTIPAKIKILIPLPRPNSLICSPSHIKNIVPPVIVIIIAIVSTMTGGTIFLMWLGEQISEFGLGNGISILIFAGIVGRIPVTIGQTISIFDPRNIINLVWILVLGLIVIAAIVFINEGHRRILVQYARRIRGNRLYGGQTTHLPLRVNQAGVIPIINS